jgi:DNA-binding CsgD family transcriptional regulator
MLIVGFTLRGRDNEIKALTPEVDRVSAGAGGTAIVEGMAGIGKTALIREVGRLSVAAGCTVAAGSADELDRITPMGALVNALLAPRPPLLTAGDLSELRASDQRWWVLDRLQQILEIESERHPLVITVDDLQWADHATVLAACSLPERLFSFPILWVFARRKTPTSPALEVALRRLREGGATSVSLGPLDDAAVAAVSTDLLGATPSRALAAELAGAAGNPFYLTHMIRRFVRTGAVDAQVRLSLVDGPVDRTGVLDSHIASLSDSSRRLLAIGSIFGRRFSLAAVADLAGQTVGQLIEPVAECRRAGFLGEEGNHLAFKHDLLRQAVYEALPGSVRRALHRDAARLLLANNAAPLDVAPHLALSAQAGDAVAIDSLRQAASSLVGTNPDAAADLALRAFELSPPSDPRRAEIAAQASDALGWTSRLSDAERVRETVLAEGSIDPITEAIIELGIRRSWIQIASCPYERPLPARLLDDPGLPASLRACLLAVEMGRRVFDDPGESARHLRAIRADADASGADFAVAAVWIYQIMAMLYTGRVSAALDEARSALAWAKEGGPDAYRLRNQALDVATALALQYLDRLDEALEVLQGGDRAAEQIGSTAVLTVDEAIRGSVLLAAGRLDDAAAVADSGRRMAEDLEHGWTLGECLRVLGEVALLRGDLAEAAACSQALQPLLDDRKAPPMSSWLPAMVADAQGDAERAFRLLEPLVKRLDRDDFTVVGHDADRLPQLVSVAVRAGEIDEAKFIATHAQRFADLNSPTPLFTGVATHCRAITERDESLFGHAVEILRGCHRPVALATALEDLGTHRIESDREGSAQALSEAYEIASKCDAQRQVARVRRKLREVGVTRRSATVARPTDGWASLTNAELAVARMVAEGQTSRAVAERLFLSTNTVNTHLRHIFTKLGVRSRVELTRVVLDRRQLDFA